MGPHVCGDSLDVFPDGRQLLTGSWREEEALEIWDFRTEKRVQALPWRSYGSREPACLLYTARLARGGSMSSERELIVAGGSFANPGGGEAKVLELSRQGDAFGESACAGTLVSFTCLSADFSTPNASLVAFGGSDGRARLMRACAIKS